MRAPMSTWFDKLLEELQRRQAEQDARREGRPLPPRPARSSRGNGDGAPPDDGTGPLPATSRRSPDATLGPDRRAGAGRLLPVRLPGRPGQPGHRPDGGTRRWAGPPSSPPGCGRRSACSSSGSWRSRCRRWPASGWRDASRRRCPSGASASSRSRTRRAPSRWGLVGVAGLLSLVSAGAWSGSWQTILLFANGGDFGSTDPNFGRDIGFYVFDLPFWRFLQGWAIASLIAILLLSLGAYAAGAMRWQFRLTAPVRAHLSILGALLLVTHRGRLPAGHPRAELLDQRLRVDPGGDLHRHERAAARVPDPDLRGAGGRRAAAAEHLVPHAVGAGPGRRRVVRASRSWWAGCTRPSSRTSRSTRTS